MLLSLIGLILFAIFFFKHKTHVDNKKREARTIRKKIGNREVSIELNNLQLHKLYRSKSILELFFDFLLRTAGKISFICFVIVFINIVFQPFAPHSLTQPIQKVIPPPNQNFNITDTGSLNGMMSALTSGNAPWWFVALVFGIPAFIIWRFFRSATYDYL